MLRDWQIQHYGESISNMGFYKDIKCPGWFGSIIVLVPISILANWQRSVSQLHLTNNPHKRKFGD
jgi:hypothetical protein